VREQDLKFEVFFSIDDLIVITEISQSEFEVSDGMSDKTLVFNICTYFYKPRISLGSDKIKINTELCARFFFTSINKLRISVSGQ